MPLGPDLLAHNLRILATRMRWPDGAVEACLQVEADHPAWLARWQHHQEWGDRPAGFYASHKDHYHLEPDVYGASEPELRAAIVSHRCPRWPPPGLPSFPPLSGPGASR